MDIEWLFCHVWIAHCEFHSRIFLFISESEEAFYNKTTENVYWLSCVIFELPVNISCSFTKNGLWCTERAIYG